MEVGHGFFLTHSTCAPDLTQASARADGRPRLALGRGLPWPLRGVGGLRPVLRPFGRNRETRGAGAVTRKIVPGLSYMYICICVHICTIMYTNILELLLLNSNMLVPIC